MWQNIIKDTIFCANFCYFSKPIFEYTKQEVDFMFMNRYSKFELEKIKNLYKEYLFTSRPKFNKPIKSKEYLIYNSKNIMVVYYKFSDFYEIYVNKNKYPKIFKEYKYCFEFINIYYPRLLISKEKWKILK